MIVADGCSFIPESPRYLISKDRREEAFEILVKYHAEGDRESIFVKAEMVQIETTIHLEAEVAKQSWWDMIATPGMRRRTSLAAAMGLFTQWSGNTLISFYLGKILVMIGYTDTHTKTMINLGNTAWSFVNGTAIALISPRFKRRTMFLTGAIGMLAVYVSWTIGMQQTMKGLEPGNKPNKAAGIAVLFFIYFYSPWYNIGNNALAYSKSLTCCITNTDANLFQLTWSNSSLMPNVLAVSQSSNSSSEAPDSLQLSSTPSVWTTRAGST